jgi:hypothetical protein
MTSGVEEAGVSSSSSFYFLGGVNLLFGSLAFSFAK